MSTANTPKPETRPAAHAAGGATPAPSGTDVRLPPPVSGKPRKGLSERNRPLWMLLPGGILMTIIIIVPLVLGIFMSMIDLDQYTLRKWVSAPFVGFKNYIEAVTQTELFHAVWLSVSYSFIATVLTAADQRGRSPDASYGADATREPSF